MKNSQEKRENKVSFFANPSAKVLCRAGVIAALYVALNYLLQPFSFGILQCRVSEALTVLPLLFPEAIPALFVGCVISNLIGNGIYDIIIGSLATLIAAVGTYLAGRFIKNKYLKFVLGGLFPVILNALAVPLIFILCGINENAYVIDALIIGAEEAAVVYTFGSALYFPVQKRISKINYNR